MSTKSFIGAVAALILFASPAQAADAGTPASPSPSSPPSPAKATPTLPTLPPPLGRIGDVVQPPPTAGTKGTELVVQGRFPGCDRDQALYLSRFLLMGAAASGEDVLQWLQGQPEVQKKLYGSAKANARPLVDAIQRARASSHFEGAACEVATKPAWKVTHLELAKDGRVVAREAPPAICKLERGPVGNGGVWLFTTPTQANAKKKDFAAAVSVAPAPEGAKDACRPRLSAALFDKEGKTRLLYHADFGGALEVQVPGNRCQTLFFTFDTSARQFIPELRRDPACGGKK